MAWVRAAIAAALLAGTGALAFLSGGYFDRPRLWAAAVAWVAVGLAAIACPRPWPRSLPAWLALGGLAGLTAWTAASIGWTPVRDGAQADTQRLLLYLGVLIAGIAVFRSRALARAAEPVLALGAFVAVAEGLSERLLPGLFTLTRSASVPGRLFQPLTYWNAMGLLAAVGLVVCARVAGDPGRPRWLRACAAAGAPALALGGYLTLSRGAVLAIGVGLALLALLRPTLPQLRALAVVGLSCAPAVVAGALLAGVRALEGSASAREVEGLVALIIVVLCSLGAAAAIAWQPTEHEALADLPLPSARRAARGVAVVTGVGVIVAFGVLWPQRYDVVVDAQASNSRLASFESNRGEFWRVARSAFAEAPLRGVGSGGFRVEWLRERPIRYAARDAHSLYFETPAELGVIGLALLLTFLGGVAACAARAVRRDPGLAAGPIAVGALWAVHAGLDWDWEMPSATLPALLLAAVLVARADEPLPAGPPGEQRAEPAAEPRRVGAEVAL
jgi:hypothetical protein